jgi:hypothetical protein
LPSRQHLLAVRLTWACRNRTADLARWAPTLATLRLSDASALNDGDELMTLPPEVYRLRPSDETVADTAYLVEWCIRSPAEDPRRFAPDG